MTTEQFSIDIVSQAYWRVTFSNGPVNLIDPDTIEELAGLLDRAAADAELRVIVFRSDNPEFFMAHWDLLADKSRVAAMQPGPTGLHPYVDNMIRLSKLPIATICLLRGRARGAGSEFALATDMRFASERAVLGQFEVGIGAVPGGGPMARLARLVGRGRALEILLGADDFDAARAADYGYVNRVIPDTDIEAEVDAFARRIAQFDRIAIARTKQFVDGPTLPDDAEFAPALAAFFETSGRPGSKPLIHSLFQRGLQQAEGVELDLGRQVVATADDSGH
ncbi:enoyl-CoA hydratase/isomerase family protein [Mycobacterium paragordonae]|uniref:Enoyl-CoA hydratase/isomerase family protein n=1 Tax=Mycobacterium paragordonae TaxID=1389713 RepID=A0A4R5WZ24_9MYCO|nr:MULTISPECIES: enoyl-CoA hydratase/isomerase family protein [Mycobacterium]MDP7737855.1 enoyl-CoA hydratase/isomerase family protein [Mycobacterium paragordonae]OBJ80185.1 enoyl-CoA hydratase [Mycobacterium gordonae]TDL02228.1 enoyl-CoA hydratase/isomerase family protein [Mycobacterium paragordonae]TDL12974.1 enoyl-CoA hydratase/isomerase family protein [Mycobacterium paragordonae]